MSTLRAEPSRDGRHPSQTGRAAQEPEDYINHISPYHFKFVADPTAFKNEPWYRQNWMAVEFNLLYRWHSLVPSKIRLGGKDVSIEDTLWNTDAAVESGLGSLLEEVSRQPAGQIGLFNTDASLREVEVASLKLSREDPRPNSVLPSLLGRLVGIDAFSQALTNPLLAPNVYNEATFSSVGLRSIARTRTLSDIVHRNISPGSKCFISMTRADWVRSG